MASKTLNIFMCNAGIFEVQPGLTEDGWIVIRHKRANVVGGDGEKSELLYREYYMPVGLGAPSVLSYKRRTLNGETARELSSLASFIGQILVPWIFL
jgi:hypothetical protein